MNAKPLAVTIGPPNPIDPGGMGPWSLPKYCIEPSGTCHRVVPCFMSTALSIPHGGGLHGRSDEAWRNRRNIP
jgi:hypothetical protein